MNSEDCTRHVDYLQQCLSSDKRPLAIFLGAGCPVAVRAGGNSYCPLIPDASGIKEHICDELAVSEECASLLETVTKHFDMDGLTNATLEDLLSHIRSLRAVAGRDRVRGLSADELDQLDTSICTLIHAITDRVLPDIRTPYHSLAGWIGAVEREYPVEVFTTNYDLLMEQAFEALGVPYFDGFAGARRPFFDLRATEEDMLPPRWARLWKLHGSINWYYIPDRGVFRGTTNESDGSRRVIHPSHLKYEESRRMPYLALLDRLRAFLRKPAATLVVCGYSFRDEHINEVLLQGLERSQSAVAFCLLYDEVVKYPQAASLARRCSNLSLLGRDGGVVSRKECRWRELDVKPGQTGGRKWVCWAPVKSASGEDRMREEFVLGDFSVLGQFLEELAGTVYPSSVKTSA